MSSAVNVVVPMGGLGTRFAKEGYSTRPKPFVRVLGEEMLLWLLRRLQLRPDDALVICYNPGFLGTGQLMRQIVAVEFPNVQLVELAGETRGAAETVLLALQVLPAAERARPTILCDSDTFYTADIVGRFREVCQSCNATFVFRDTQPKPIYSYVRLADNDAVVEVREKVKISDWANSGCYCFSNGEELAQQCAALLHTGETQLSQNKVGEFYTSGVIAAMLKLGHPFKALKLERADHHVVGTPAQLVAFTGTWAEALPARHFLVSLEHALQRPGSKEPDPSTVDFCRRARAQGHVVVLSSCGTVGEAEGWLRRHGVVVDEVRVGQRKADFVIDRRGVDPRQEDLSKQLGYYETSRAAHVTANMSEGFARHDEREGPHVSTFLLGVGLGITLAVAAVFAGGAASSKRAAGK